ncbi:MAG: hypothetical protein IPI49_07550 [Myxococcales bacterium]|nr:hypothetical protein [Myxococcales bacterium]
MPQVIEFPTLGSDARTALATVVRICKETRRGEPFRELRSRLRAAKVWDKERPTVSLRFFGVSGTPIRPSPFMEAVAAAANDDDIATAILDRMWRLNPVLMKSVLDLVGQRAYGKDEISKFLGSSVYRGQVPPRPSLETWLQLCIGCGLLKAVGIAVAVGPRAAPWVAHAADLDIDEFLQEDRPEPEPVLPVAGDDDPAGGADSPGVGGAGAASAAQPSGPIVPVPLRHVLALETPSPRGKERPVPVSRFALEFSSELLDETRQRITSWWKEVKPERGGYEPKDFGLEPEAWVESADEVVYRLAVAAALVFRLDKDRADVLQSFTGLDQAGVLSDLYQGNVPETIPAAVDARALMLASLAARRCAEVPELAASLESQPSAEGLFATLDGALGRGLFRIELFWILDQLHRLGVIRPPDIDEVTTTPYRLVRDTLFRLGFLATPYAHDAAGLAAAARAAKLACGEGAADEALVRFALAAGCGYDCQHRRSCDFACRERLE